MHLISRLTSVLFSLAVAAHAWSQVDPNRVVAVINGEELKGSEYYRRMEYLNGVGRQMGQMFAELPPAILVIDRIVTDRLTLQLAREKGAAPTELEVNAEFAQRLKNNPDLLKTWTDSGRTEAELKEQIKVEIAQFKIITFGVTVTDQEVDRIYKERDADFRIPKQYKLSVIAVTTKEEQAAVDADLKANKPFDEVARTRSKDASRATGGQYGVLPVTMLGAAVLEALNKVKIGGVADWLQSGTDGDTTFIKFKIDDIIAEKKQELTPELRSNIRKTRMVELGRVKNNIVKEMAAMRSKARVEIRQPELQKAYDQLIQGYLKQSAGGQ
ncbi:MAG: peptidyl-prolyl cis-trans isomerase [Fimbriimonadaceae bacterium]|nr:peptidyl-prolyl cis-trans isomerase [Fimbriimonadaceae bacterium]